MASYRKRGKGFEVFYTYKDKKTGKKKQGTQTVYTEADARRLCVEYDANGLDNDYVSPNKDTIAALLDDFVDSYGAKKWGFSQYQGKTGLIRNYIKPLIGHKRAQTFTTRDADMFLDELGRTYAVRQKFPNDPQFVTPVTVREIGEFMRTVFKQAKKWNVVKKNPFEDATLPEYDAEVREMWEADTIATALGYCRENCLYIALHLAFACNMREGEVCGLQWDRVYISDEDIQADNARVAIDRQLARVSKEAIKKLGKKDILFIFPTTLKSEKEVVQRLVLKKPKTKNSNRTVWIPAALAYILQDYQKHQDNIKAIMGKDYKDYGLVLAQSDGRPYDNNLISRKFRNLIAAHSDLPKVVFHSLRVSATTYKLALSKGDIKSVQGDNGHATADMTLRTYARVLDSGRKVNAQRFNEFFYPGKYERGRAEHAAPPLTVTPEELVEQIKKSPEALATLAVMLKGVLNTSNAHENTEMEHTASGRTRPKLTILK